MQTTDQETLWNGRAGRAWVDTQDVLDQMFRPLQEPLTRGLKGGTVLDVGCGTGGTTLAAARVRGAECTGIDISRPMIEAARARAAEDGARVTFIQGNAQSYPFEASSFDTILSRFGVMFFDDPVCAFGNLHRATKAGGDLRFLAWRSPAENPFMTTAERAAAPLLPDLPPRQPEAPGQFAFADATRVQTILTVSGWQDVVIRPVDALCSFPARELDRYISRLGPVGLVLQGADDSTRARVLATVREAFEAYVYETEVRFTAACWLVSAHSDALR